MKGKQILSKSVSRYNLTPPTDLKLLYASNIVKITSHGQALRGQFEIAVLPARVSETEHRVSGFSDYEVFNR